jgi:predicted nicotinamide N-methyase
MAGAARVEAADIDPFSGQAVAANAALNGVAIDCTTQDLLGAAPRWDVVLAADLWYERFMARAVTTWLHDLARQGVQVLAADHGRAFFPREDLTLLARYRVETSQGLEADVRSEVGVWTLREAS